MSIEAMKQIIGIIESVSWLGPHAELAKAVRIGKQTIAEAEKQEVSGLKLIHRADIDLTKKIEAEKQEPTYSHKGKCNRIMPDGKLCQFNAPCPDCGMSLIG
jgi:hypothetical protein